MINKIPSLTIAITILVLLGSVSTNWYLQSKVDNFLDEIIKELYPIAVIKY
jgi:hypothetical protein